MYKENALKILHFCMKMKSDRTLSQNYKSKLIVWSSDSELQVGGSNLELLVKKLFDCGHLWSQLKVLDQDIRRPV